MESDKATDLRDSTSDGDPPTKDEAEARSRLVFRVDKRERLVGFGAALAAVALFCAIWIPKLHEHVAKTKTATLSPSTSLIYGLVMAAALAAAAAIGRRALLGFVVLGVGLGGPWNTFILGQVVYLGIAAWLLVHAYRVSAEARKAAQAQRAAAGASAPSTGARAGRGTENTDAEPTRSGSRRRDRRGSGSARSAPKASKRYTPPKPARKKRASGNAVASREGSSRRS